MNHCLKLVGNSCGHVSLVLPQYKGPESTVWRGPESEQAILEQNTPKLWFSAWAPLGFSGLSWITLTPSCQWMDSLLSCLQSGPAVWSGVNIPSLPPLAMYAVTHWGSTKAQAGACLHLCGFLSLQPWPSLQKGCQEGHFLWGSAYHCFPELLFLWLAPILGFSCRVHSSALLGSVLPSGAVWC